MVRARTSSPQRGRTLSPHRGTGLLPAAPPQRVCASIRLGRGFPLAPQDMPRKTPATARAGAPLPWAHAPDRAAVGACRAVAGRHDDLASSPSPPHARRQDDRARQRVQ